MIVAVSGKGGVGKTMFSALLIKALNEQGERNILAIDADPNANLGAALGVGFERTIGDLREGVLELVEHLPDKRAYLEGKAFELTVETENFDLLVMGRPEGPGCYCAVNHILREIIDGVSRAYKYTIVDSEAGLEHLSRRTTAGADKMVVLTDPSRSGFVTTLRIKELASSLRRVREMFLVVNRASENEALRKAVEETGLELLGFVPEDALVAEYNLLGKPLYELPPSSVAYQAVKRIALRLFYGT